MLYSTLTQSHPSRKPEVWGQIEELYHGGFDLVENAATYLPQQVGEPPQRYRERLQMASYVPYLGAIVDFFVATLFSKPLFVLPGTDAEDLETIGGLPADEKVYQAFSVDADRSRTTFSDVMREVFTTAMLKRVSYLGVDFPAADMQFTSLADEMYAGRSTPYVVRIAPEELLDWKLDEYGNFDWVVLYRRRCERVKPSDTRTSVSDEFKVWEMRDGRAVWSTFALGPRNPNQMVSEKEDVPLVAEGVTSFRTVPLVPISLPHGLWIGNKIGILAREHFQRRSALCAAENRSMFAIPFIKLGPEMSAPGAALPSEAQQNSSRGDRGPAMSFVARGFMTLGSEDEVGFAEPTGSSYALVDKQLVDLVNEMYRTAYQMSQSVSSTTQALGRSGRSKSHDNDATSIILEAYAEIVKSAAIKVFQIISSARGDNVEWQAHGLNHVVSGDRAELIQEAAAVGGIQIPSPTFRKLYLGKLSGELLGNVSPTTQAAIVAEISAVVDAESEHLDPFAASAPIALESEDTESGTEDV